MRLFGLQITRATVSRDDIHTTSSRKYSFSEEDREASAELRSLRQQIKMEKERYQLEKARAELEDLRESLQPEDDGEDGGEDSTEDALLKMLMTNAMQQPQQLNTPPPSSQHTTEVSMSDAEILHVLKGVPKPQRVLLKTLPDKVLAPKIKQQFNVDDDTVQRALVLIRK